jgi:hypothetical protein
MSALRFGFAFDPLYRLAGLPFGVTASTALVVVDPDRGTLLARFGPWRVETSLANVTGVELAGPYRRITTIGPARLSFADRGLTFATNNRRGVCVSFADPAPGIEPTGRLRHPNLTVTVADPDGLAAALCG